MQIFWCLIFNPLLLNKCKPFWRFEECISLVLGLPLAAMGVQLFDILDYRSDAKVGLAHWGPCFFVLGRKVWAMTLEMRKDRHCTIKSFLGKRQHLHSCKAELFQHKTFIINFVIAPMTHQVTRWIISYSIFLIIWDRPQSKLHSKSKRAVLLHFTQGVPHTYLTKCTRTKAG